MYTTHIWYIHHLGLDTNIPTRLRYGVAGSLLRSVSVYAYIDSYIHTLSFRGFFYFLFVCSDTTLPTYLH